MDIITQQHKTLTINVITNYIYNKRILAASRFTSKNFTKFGLPQHYGNIKINDKLITLNCRGISTEFRVTKRFKSFATATILYSVFGCCL